MTSSVNALLGQLSENVINSTLQQTRGELFSLLHTDGADVRTYLRTMRGKTDALDALITEIMCRVLQEKVTAENALEKLVRDETILRRDIMQIGEGLVCDMQILIANARDESVRLAYEARERLTEEEHHAERERPADEHQHAERGRLAEEQRAGSSSKYFWEVILSIIGVALGVLMISMA